MKKAITIIIGIVIFLMMFVGFYMMLSNIGRNFQAMLIYMGIFIAGIFGLIMYAVVLMYYRHKKKLEALPKDEEKVEE